MSDRELIVNNTRLKILHGPIFRHERDAAYWAVKTEVLEGEWKGQQGWLVSDKETGPWEPAGAGFV